MRRISRELGKLQANIEKACRNPITYENVLTILEVRNEIKHWIAQNNFVISEKSKILKYSHKIVYQSFQENLIKKN